MPDGIRCTCPLVFIDTETTRLRPPHLPGGRRIWEIGAIRDDADGTQTLHAFIRFEDLALQELLDDTAPSVALAMLVGDPHAPTPGPRGEWLQHLPGDVQESLDIGQFHQRHPERAGTAEPVMSQEEAADALMEMFTGRPHLVGCVPSFDADSVHDLLLRTARLPNYDTLPWHYQPVDVEAFAAGAVGGWLPPWDSEALSRQLGVDPAAFHRHRALDDAMWARALFYAAVKEQ